MIYNYFKTAFRMLLRYRSYSIINVAGLSVGMAACLLLFLVVRYELSFDTFQPHYRSIYNIMTRDDFSDGVEYTPGVPFPALEALRADLPELKTGALFSNYGCQVNTIGEGAQKKFIEDMGVFFCDPQFFEVFSYRWLIGSPAALSEPNKIALTKSIAEKYFGDWKTAVGKNLKMDNTLTLQVAGILDDVPRNTDFPLRLVGSYISIQKSPAYGYTTDWGSTTSNFQLYTLLPEHVTQKEIEARLQRLSDKYYTKVSGNHRVNLLRPLSENHFDTVVGNLGTHITSRASITTLSFIGLLIILMACINFINLSTAQAVTRSKEVGVRKVLGGNRKQLFRQMLGETLIIVLFAGMLSLLLAKLALPYIKHIISIDETLQLLSFQSALFFILVILSVTLLSGIYPALILSGFQPVAALKNKITSATIGGISLRRGLVVMQFMISQLLIIGTIVAVSQMNFVRNADLGFNTETTLLLFGNNDSLSRAAQAPFRQELLQIPGVRSVSFNSDAPSSSNNSGTNFSYDHRPDEKYSVFLKLADENYFKTFGLRFIAGGPYEKKDSIRKVVVNETFLKKLNIKNPNEAIGKTMRISVKLEKTICGVVRDFKTNSLREEIRPIAIFPMPRRYFVTAIKLQEAGLQNSMAAIQRSWDKFYPDYVFNNRFMDKSIENFYEQENQMALLYKVFAGLAVFISCLGLYGLISFMAVQKTKEVGIRKVLGARVAHIVFLFSKEFTLLIALAFIISAPLAYYFMNSWLQNFVYRIHIGAGVFVIAIFTSIIIAWITVGYKALRAALANPIKSLRTE